MSNISTAAQAHARRLNVLNELRTLDESVNGAEFNGEQLATEARLTDEARRLDRIVESNLSDAQLASDIAASENRFGARGTGAQTGMVSSADTFLRSATPGQSMELNLTGFEERAAMAKGADATGGYAVPVSMADAVMNKLNIAGMREAGLTVISTTAGEDITIPKTDASPAAAVVLEGGTYTSSDGTFGQATMKAWKLGFLSTVSSELLNDAAFNVENYVAAIGGRALDAAIESALTIGNGTATAEGVTTIGTTGGTLATKGVVTADELIDFVYSLAPQYRRNAVILTSDALLLAARKLKDSNNQYLWAPGMVAGEPDTFLGKPILQGSAYPALAATVDIKQATIFDPTSYMLRFAGPLRVERSIDANWDTDQVSFRFSLRFDGRSVDDSAFKQLVNPAV